MGKKIAETLKKEGEKVVDKTVDKGKKAGKSLSDWIAGKLHGENKKG